MADVLEQLLRPYLILPSQVTPNQPVAHRALSEARQIASPELFKLEGLSPDARNAFFGLMGFCAIVNRGRKESRDVFNLMRREEQAQLVKLISPLVRHLPTACNASILCADDSEMQHLQALSLATYMCSFWLTADSLDILRIAGVMQDLLSRNSSDPSDLLRTGFLAVDLELSATSIQSSTYVNDFVAVIRERNRHRHITTFWLYVPRRILTSDDPNALTGYIEDTLSGKYTIGLQRFLTSSNTLPILVK